MTSFQFLPLKKPTWKIQAALWNGAMWSDTYRGDCIYAPKIQHQSEKEASMKKNLGSNLKWLCDITLLCFSKCWALQVVFFRECRIYFPPNLLCLFSTPQRCLPTPVWKNLPSQRTVANSLALFTERLSTVLDRDRVVNFRQWVWS